VITYTRQRFTAATLTNGKYELTSERQTVTDQILFIPGVSSPLAELKNLLFKQGQAGGIWVPSLSPTMISSESFGTGVQTFLDLSGNGKNATQASSGSRPAWGRVPKSGRVNLAVRSDEFNQSPWSTTNLDVTANAIAAPDGSLTADKIFATASAGVTHNIRQSVTVVSGSTLTFSFYAKSGGYNFVRFWEDSLTGKQGYFNLSTGVATNSNLDSIGMEDAGNGWWRCYGTLNSFGGTTYGFRIHPTPDGTTTIYDGDGSSGVHVWRAMLNVGSTPATPQKVTTAFDITESGQRDCYYLQPDGVDDGMATASIDFSGTDAITTFMAVRKLTDSAAQMMLELSASWALNAGSFSLQSSSGGGANFTSTSRGDAAVDAGTQTATASGIAAPATRILTQLADISSDQNILRVNGVQAASATGNQGAGNYGNYPLYFFRRNLATLQANQQCFGIIVAGGSYPTSTIERVERILSRYTPGVSL
jgi:hypothetical protein